MGNFKYQALDSKGREVSDFIEAVNSKEAISKIRRMGLFPTKVRGVSAAQVEDAKTNEALTSDEDSSSPGYLFGIKRYKCKDIQGFEPVKGHLNILAKDEETFLSFRAESDSMALNDEMLVNLNDIRGLKLSGFLSKRLAVTSTKGDSIFAGDVKRISEVLRFELKARGILL